jgi:hypothetical protein
MPSSEHRGTLKIQRRVANERAPAGAERVDLAIGGLPPRCSVRKAFDFICACLEVGRDFIPYAA